MKEIITNELQVGDIYYYQDRYEVVIDTLQFSAYVKCIMAPTKSKHFRSIGDHYYMPRYQEVLLLVRNGVEV